MSGSRFFEFALDDALYADLCRQKLDKLQAEYLPKREAFDRYLYGPAGSARVDRPEFYVDDFRILRCAKEAYEKSADACWECYRTEAEEEHAA